MTRVGSGYRMREVDEFLDQMTDTMSALVAENERLRDDRVERSPRRRRARPVRRPRRAGRPRRGGCVPPTGEGVPPGPRRARPGARRRAAIDGPRRSERARGAGHADGTRGPRWHRCAAPVAAPTSRSRSSERRACVPIDERRSRVRSRIERARRSPRRATPSRTTPRPGRDDHRRGRRRADPARGARARAIGTIGREGGRFAPGAVLGRGVSGGPHAAFLRLTIDRRRRRAPTPDGTRPRRRSARSAASVSSAISSPMRGQRLGGFARRLDAELDPIRHLEAGRLARVLDHADELAGHALHAGAPA